MRRTADWLCVTSTKYTPPTIQSLTVSQNLHPLNIHRTYRTYRTHSRTATAHTADYPSGYSHDETLIAVPVVEVIEDRLRCTCVRPVCVCVLRRRPPSAREHLNAKAKASCERILRSHSPVVGQKPEEKFPSSANFALAIPSSPS